MNNLNVLLKNSPKFKTKIRSNKGIKIIVIHYTGMQSGVDALNRLTDFKSKVSCHYLINEKGQIISIIPDNYTAWHAGKSRWGKLSSLNKYSIGIELVNPGHNFGYKKFRKKQISSLIQLIKKLIKKYNINKKNIVGHSDIAPLRKKDPGEKFPWKILAKSNIGIWHNLKQKKLMKNRKKKILKKEKLIFFKFLNKIGFQTRFNIKKSKYQKKLIEAFQRRFRPELISGIIDKECFFIAKNISL
jgi:N-acetylmuramoyl-L-alanine amidase